MLYFFITVGLPGSGKSTFANNLKEQLPGLAIIERDAIRHAQFNIFASREAVENYYNSRFYKRHEKIVDGLFNYELQEAIYNEKHICISDTNLDVKRIEELLNIAIDNGYKPIVVNFTNVKVEKILEMNDNREDVKIVPSDVMRRMIAKLPSVQGGIWELRDKYDFEHVVVR